MRLLILPLSVRRWSLTSLRLVALALLTAGCAGPIPSLSLPRPDQPTKPVWIVDHGWHVGIAFRQTDVSLAIWPESEGFGALRHLEVGWGDGVFYPTEHGTTRMALRAAFFSKFSVLHVAGFDAPVGEFFAGAPVVEIDLSPQGFDRLTRFIHEYYKLDERGRPIPMAPSAYGRGHFYLARGHYHVLDNSNTWAARGLREAGLPITPFGAITASSVMRQLTPVVPALTGP